MISNSLNLKQLEALIWVADLGSFRKAAYHLNTTQPNISARIAALETSLGQTLMHRDTGSIRMTPKGDAILQQARQVLAHADQLLQIADRDDLIENHLRLGVTEMVACTWLREFLREMKETYPKIAIELTVDLSKNLDAMILANELDLAIQTAPFTTKGSLVLELGHSKFTWVAAPAIASNLPANLTAHDLSDQTILTHARHTQSFVDVERGFADAGLPHMRFSPSSSLTSVLHMAIDGMGVGVLPRAMVLGHLNDHSLCELGMNWHPSPLQFAARYQVVRTDAYLSVAADLAKKYASAVND